MKSNPFYTVSLLDSLSRFKSDKESNGVAKSSEDMNRLKKSRQEKGYKNVTDDDDGVIVINDQSSCTRNMKERLHETHRNITDFAKNGAPASSASIKVKGIGNISKQSKCHMSLLRMD